jgi:hypothetical protein
MSNFSEVSASGSDWGPVTKASIDGDSFEFQRFKLPDELKCIGYSNFFEGQWGGAGELLFGFMCKKAAEIQENQLSAFLENLTIR